MDRRDAGMLAPLFERSMGLDDAWRVSDVWFVDREGGQDELHIRVERARGHTVRCPECGRECGVYDTTDERVWRHLDIWQYRTYVHCEVPRADCPDHSPRVVRVPWEMRAKSHFTALFEAMVVTMYQSGMVASQIARFVGESDDVIWRMLGHAVDDALARADYSEVRRVGVDETSKAKGHTYISTMMDLDAGRVVAVTDGNDKGAVGRMCEQLEAHGGDRKAIEEVTRDMSGSFKSGVDAEMPQAAQTVDRFHVMQLFSKATDKVRCAERRESAEKAELLKRTKYAWLKSEENLTEGQAEIRRRLDPKRSHLKTARACQMTEAMRDVYEADTLEEAELRLDGVLSWIMHSNVPEMKKVAKTVRENRRGIMSYFRSKLTNAYVEGANSIIQQIKKAARGFRNTKYFRTAIFLRLGGLSFESVASYATH